VVCGVLNGFGRVASSIVVETGAAPDSRISREAALSFPRRL
jgi:hypothetical protein